MSYPGELACMPFLNKPHPQYVIVGVSKGGGGHFYNGLYMGRLSPNKYLFLSDFSYYY